MKLRSKLMLSFSCLLVCIATMAYIGLSSIKEMVRFNGITQSLSDAVTSINDIRYYQLNYIHYNDPSQIDIVIKNIDKAKADFQMVYNALNIPENRASITEAIKNLDDVRMHFQVYSGLHEESNEAYKKISALGGLVSTSSIETLALAEQLLAEDPSSTNISRFRAIVNATDALYKGRIGVNKFIITPNKINADDANKNINEARKTYDDSVALFAGTRYTAELEALAKQIQDYETAAADYLQKALERDAYIQNITSIMPKLVEQAASVFTSVSKVSQGVQDDAYIEIVAALAIAIAFGIGLSILLTHNVISTLGRDPSQLSTMTKRVIAEDYEIADGGAAKGVYGDLLAMVESLRKNIAKAAAESENAKLESAKAHEATLAAEKAKEYAESAKRQGMLDAAAQLEGVVSVLSSASTQLSAQIEQSKQGSAEQAHLISESATAMEEMTSTVIEVARNASQAAEMAKLSKEKATEGAHIVTDSVTSIQNVRENSNALKEDMLALVQHTQAISEIMAVISDIADQTNMLALNAAIEAARAGDAGRGFAVVADEVRNLAEKTMASTSNVSRVISSIQTSVDKSMKQLDATVINVEASTEHAVRSGNALREIVDMADGAVDQVRAIATASEEQSATSEEINRAIAHVNVITQETARGLLESASAVAELARQSEALVGLIEEMKRS